jgi:hypothetical protein
MLTIIKIDGFTTVYFFVLIDSFHSTYLEWLNLRQSFYIVITGGT